MPVTKKQAPSPAPEYECTLPKGVHQLPGGEMIDTSCITEAQLKKYGPKYPKYFRLKS